MLKLLCQSIHYLTQGTIASSISNSQPQVSNEKEIPMVTVAARKKVEEMLQQVREGQHPHDDSPETATDQLLNVLCYKDFEALRCAQAKLTIQAKD
jgi:hypothetical protein